MLSCSFKLPPRLQTRPLPNSFLGDSAIRLTTKTRKKESKKRKKKKKRRRARRRRRRRRLCSDTTRRGVDELMERSVKRFSARYLFLRLFSLNSLPYLISRPVFPTFSFFFSSLRSSLLHARLDAESERRLKGLCFFFWIRQASSGFLFRFFFLLLFTERNAESRCMLFHYYHFDFYVIRIVYRFYSTNHLYLRTNCCYRKLISLC